MFVLMAFMLQITLAVSPLVAADGEAGAIAEIIGASSTENEGSANGDGPGEGSGDEAEGSAAGGEEDGPVGDGSDSPQSLGDTEVEDDNGKIEAEEPGADESVAGEDESVAETEEPGAEAAQEKRSMKVLMGASQDLGNIFTGFTLQIKHGSAESVELKENEAIDIQEETVVLLTYDWEIANEVNLVAGDWAQITIPSVFKGMEGKLTGDLERKGMDPVGTYTIDGDTLKIVFNEELLDLENRKGDVWVGLQFNLEEFEEDVIQTIEFKHPINKTFTVAIKPKGDLGIITKLGVPNEKINATHIDWSIEVNKSMDLLDEAIVGDTIPDGLEIVAGTLKIYKLIVGYEGKVEKGERVFPETTEFPVALGKIDSAYLIEYQTNITDNTKESYKNAATLKDREELKDTAYFEVDKLEFGSLIEKTGEAENNGENSTNITWTIDVNKAQLDLKDVSVEDVILEKPEGVELAADVDTIKVYKLSSVGGVWEQGSEVESITPPIDLGGGFSISLGDLNKEARRIVFDTGITYDHYHPTNEFENKAILKVGDQEKDTSEKKVTVERLSLIKKFGEESPYTDTIKWTILVNRANHSIENAIIKDQMGTGLKLNQGSIEVRDHKGNDITDDESVRITDKTDQGFTVGLGTISKSYTITYTTEITDLAALNNEAELKGDDLKGTGIYDGVIKTAELIPGQVSNSYLKSTVEDVTIGDSTYDGLNYMTKTMSWKIAVDAQKEEVTEITITDTFAPSESMVFLADSLKVVRSDNNSVVTDYVLTDKKQEGFVLELTGPLARTKYEIYFKTSFDPNKVLEESGKLNDSSTYKTRQVSLVKLKM